MKRVIFIKLLASFAVFLFAAFAFAGTSPQDRFIYPEYSKTISMDFENANLTDVLKIFSQQSGLNFIAADEIANKKITLFLDKVPVEEALERILQANALTYEIKPGSNIFVVKSSEADDKRLITRIYKLKYATVSSSKLNQTFNISDPESGEDKSGGTSGNALSGLVEGAQASNSGIVGALKTVISEKGKIVEDPRTNSLIISDTLAHFPAIEKTIARLDVPVPQILIETEMLDISKNTADLLGVKPGDTLLSFTGAKREHYYPWNENEILSEGEATTAPDYTVGTIDASGLTATLQMLRTQTDTRNLARPRILTLNNETAQIKISTNEAIGIKSITQAAQGSSVQSVEAERVETGVFLTVTPQANIDTREITMAISPRVIEAKTGGTFSNQTFRDPENRGTKSILRVSDGETIVIGGLMRNNDQDIRRKIPVIGDIPILGAAFRHKDKSVTDRELVIFITPHIVSGKGTSKLALGPQEPLVREQEIPVKRSQAIDKALSNFEKR